MNKARLVKQHTLVKQHEFLPDAHTLIECQTPVVTTKALTTRLAEWTHARQTAETPCPRATWNALFALTPAKETA